MPEVEEVFRLATNKVKPNPNALERQERRQRSAVRANRARAYVAVAAVIAITVAGAITILRAVNNEEGIPSDTNAPTAPGTLTFVDSIFPLSQKQTPTIVDLRGNQTTTLPGFSKDGFAPSVSADGSTIAFVAVPNELAYNQIAVMNADGSDPHFVATPSLDVGIVALSPDASKIAFEALGDGNTDIYVVGVDGSGLRQLTDHPATDQYPQWSPDGTTIVYDDAGTHEDTSDPQFSRTAEIWTVPADGNSAPTRLTDNGTSDSSPSFSPDGKRIAYFHDGEIWTMTPDGGDQHRLVWNGQGGFTPRWSPNGKLIAFTYFVDTYRPDVQLAGEHGPKPLCILALVDVTTGQITKLTNVGMATDRNTPQWVDDSHVLVMRVPVKNPLA